MRGSTLCQAGTKQLTGKMDGIGSFLFSQRDPVYRMSMTIGGGRSVGRKGAPLGNRE